MKPYDHKKIEKKWQAFWKKKKLYEAADPKKSAKSSGIKGKKAAKGQAKKFYSLIEFPYPSGDGLHVGHPRPYIGMDVISRKRRMEGYNVLYPIGWDAFGLPTENYAIKTGKDPRVVTKENSATFRRQIQSLGISFDWSREVNTTDPAYYKWTQWIFLQFLKAGLAYKKKMTINWCPKDLIGLANEEVVDGKCERCGTPVEKREKEQWMLAITKYADRLDRDLDTVDYLPQIKTQQRNWIGKSEGAEIDFRISVEKNKPRFVLLHGFEGSATTNFFPWLKAELEKRGHDVEAPELPNAENPKESEQVEYVLKNCFFDENTVIIGHSLGAVVAMKTLTKLDRKISGLVLVAPAVDPAFGSPDSKIFQKNFTWDFDHSRIRELTGGKIAVLSDTREKKRAPYLKHLAGELLAHLVETTSREFHFCADQEPEILKSVTPLIKVFTTRPDTLFGVTYVVLSPEHPWVGELLPRLENKTDVQGYMEKAKKETDIERTDAKREKTGVELKGVKAVNPVNGEKVPIWIADYVLADYGTGAVMAVPAHDDRDWDFAKKYNLPIKEVVMPLRIDQKNPPQAGKKTVERKTVHALVRDPKTRKILCIKWKKFPWTGFVIGGVDAGEDIVDAVRREVLEETGYKNLKFSRVLGGQVRGEYFAAHKDENRIAFSNAILFELENEERMPVSQEEADKHEAVWLDPKTLNHANFTCAELDLWLERIHTKNEAYAGEGILVNSGKFDGKKSEEILKEITAAAGGEWVVKFKLRDWIFSRQRYWGEPIPVVHCEKCGIVPLAEKDLPLKLPLVKNYKPTETGESPLAAISKWVNVKCPKCKGPARRETDTMPNWAGSSWYYLRYTDPKNTKAFAAPDRLKYWTPVDWYNGGMEHTTLHVLYSRFWHKFLFDQALVPTAEPYQKRTSHGLILAKGGEKMSKSKGNVVNPDSIVESVGADSLRLYEMFMGPFDQAIAWDENGIVGCRRFIERVWKLQEKLTTVEVASGVPDVSVARRVAPLAHEILMNKTIKKVSEDIEAMRFNTAVSTLMIAVNEFEKDANREGAAPVAREHYEILLALLAPFAPHVAEDIWQQLFKKENPKIVSVHQLPWPVFDPTKIKEATVTIPIQINGKTRATVRMSPDATEEEVKNMALNMPEIMKWVDRNDQKGLADGQKPNIKKVIYVKGRLLNLVIDLTSRQQNDTTST